MSMEQNRPKKVKITTACRQIMKRPKILYEKHTSLAAECYTENNVKVNISCNKHR